MDIQLNIEFVDGVQPRKWSFWNAGRVTEVEVLPGPHVIEVSLTKGDSVRSTQNAVVGFDTQPAKTYLVHAAIVEEGFWSEVGKAMFGGYGSWIIWVVDAESNRTIAGEAPPPTPTPNRPKDPRIHGR